MPVLLRLLDRLEEAIIATLIAAATLIIFVAVVHRYGLSASIGVSRWGVAHGLATVAATGRSVFMALRTIDLGWAQELCVYMFVWMAKFGAAFGVRTGIHVGVDLLINRLDVAQRKPVITAGLLAGALFTGLVGTFGASFVYQLIGTGQVSPDMEVPIWLVYLAVPLGSYLMCFRFLQVLWRFHRTGGLPQYDHGHVEGLDAEVEPALLQPAPAADVPLPPLVPASPGPPVASRGGYLLATLIVVLPLLLLGLALAGKFELVTLPGGARVALIFGLLVAMMATGMPVSIALGLTVLILLFTLTTVPIEAVALKLFTGIEKFEIMAIPFFILAGNFLTHGGVARRMIRFATALIGHWHGGLGLAGVLACALFAAISGSSPATVAAIGSIVLPAMVAQGFPKRFGAGVITTSGALGILIPPSIVMVIYAVATSGMVLEGPHGEKVSSASVGTLFMAGVIPGAVLATMLGATTWYRAWKNDYPRARPATWSELRHAFFDSFWGLALIIIVIGGIYGGAFTPTEAAAMSAVYAFIVAVFVYRDLTLFDVPKVLLASASMSAMLLYIITNAVLFSFLMTSEQIPQAMAGWIAHSGLGWVGFLMLVNVLLLLAGNVMEPSSIVLIMAPILFPVAVKLGIDPVHFGIIMVVNMEVGLCHPPVGLNLYVASGITKMGMTELTIAVWPWLLTMLVFLVLVTYVPALSLWLPQLLGLLQ